MQSLIFVFICLFGGYLVTANTIVIVKTDEDLKTVLEDLGDTKQDESPIPSFGNNEDLLRSLDEYPVGLVDDEQGLSFNRDQGLDFDKKQGLDLYGDDQNLWFENRGGLDFNPEQGLDFDNEQGLDFDKETGLDFDKKQGLDLYGDDQNLWFENGGGLDFNAEQGLDLDKETGLDFNKKQTLDLFGNFNREQGLDFNKEQGLNYYEDDDYNDDQDNYLNDYEEEVHDHKIGGLFDSQSDEDSFLLDLYGEPNKVKDTNNEDILNRIERDEFIICGVVAGFISFLGFSIVLFVWLRKNSTSRGTYTKLSSFEDVEDNPEIIIYPPEKPVN